MGQLFYIGSGRNGAEGGYTWGTDSPCQADRQEVVGLGNRVVEVRRLLTSTPLSSMESLMYYEGLSLKTDHLHSRLQPESRQVPRRGIRVFQLAGWLAVWLILPPASGVLADPAKPTPAQSADADSVEPGDFFVHRVVPILRKHCVECHGGDKSEGGFSLNRRALLLDAEAVKPGDVAGSQLWQLVNSDDAERQMPPADRPRLNKAELATLRKWIEQKVPWQEGFTFSAARYEPPLRLRHFPLPAAGPGRDHPVDRIIDAYLTERKLPLPGVIDDARFARRAWLDLVGLLPPPDELAAFVADQDSKKRAKLVERLLADDGAYADHWLSFWNDLLRNAYSGTGYIDGGRRQITGWLYQSLYENKPYDQFVRELISPDASASGFNRGIKWLGNVNASQTTEVQFAQNTTQVFLGINMKCASCHDSFIDRWTLEEAYGLAAMVASEPLEIYRCDKATGKMAQASWIFPELGQVDAAATPGVRLKQLAGLMTHADNGRFARTMVNRLWHRLMGRGIVHPTDAMHTPPWSEELLEYLAVHLTEHDYDLREMLRLIATSAAYQAPAEVLHEDAEPAKFVYHGPRARRLTAEQLLDALATISGVWPQPNVLDHWTDGRSQGGQLAAVLVALGEVKAGEMDKAVTVINQWGGRPTRAALTRLDPLQATLGRPNREQVVTTRPDQVTTLEAIHLANGKHLADLLKRSAAARLATHQGSPQELVESVYGQALSREPTPDELEIAVQLLGTPATANGLEDLLWTLFVLPEFQLIR